MNRDCRQSENELRQSSRLPFVLSKVIPLVDRVSISARFLSLLRRSALFQLKEIGSISSQISGGFSVHSFDIIV